jgi:GNAT superfamily N-acetyltransferase
MRRWAIFAAYSERRRVGGAAIVMDSPEIDLLEGRTDVALLWDIRVEPTGRRNGVGSALLAEVERWALERNAVHLMVETQNVNPPACRFYEKQGFGLQSANANAYPAMPNEIQLLWYKTLG